MAESKKSIVERSVSALDNFLSSEYDGIFYVGHASIIARINKKNYLFDYVKETLPYGALWRFFPALTSNVPLQAIDGIFVSHIHQDHFDPAYLRLAQAQCPIYIIGGRPSFSTALSKQGVNVIEIPPAQKFQIADNVFVKGFLHQSNGVDASCVLGSKNFCVYHGNDNYLDNLLLQKIDQELSSVDVACIPYAYINWYPQLLENLTLEEKQAESDRLCNFYFEYAIEQANFLRAKQIVPFGANLVYRDRARSPLNLECKTPIEFEEYVFKTRGADEASRFKALFSGDTIVKRGAELIVTRKSNLNGNSYREEMQVFLDSIQDSEDRGEEDNDAIWRWVDLIAPSFSISRPTAATHLVIVGCKSASHGVAIDTKSGRSRIFDFDALDKELLPYTMITVNDSRLFERWAHRHISLEEIIGSRQFSIYRNPDVYDKDVLRVIINEL